jgi:hypothetical protein
MDTETNQIAARATTSRHLSKRDRVGERVWMILCSVMAGSVGVLGVGISESPIVLW